MKRCLLISLVFALTWTPTLATDLRLSPLDVISRNGQLNARDGIIAYTLKKDGSFSLFPLALSGTWVDGIWKLESSSNGLRVQVQGLWGGVNQISPNRQSIIMRVAIQPGVLHDTGHPETDIYKCSVTTGDTKYDFHLPPSLNMVPLTPGKLAY